jgi:FkbM family methyltransferase
MTQTSMKRFLKSQPLIGRALRCVGRLRLRYYRWKVDPARKLQNILRGRKDLCVVQIGSNDGSTGDPIYLLLQSNPSWKAILVEPVPFLFERLCESYSNNPNIQFANVAITDRAGMATFYYVDPAAKNHLPELPCWSEQIGSFDPGHIARHLGNKLERFTLSKQISTFSLSSLLERNNVTHIDLLNIDTEGHDWIVLRQLDLSRFRPDVILIEHKHLSKGDKDKAFAFLERNYKITDLGADFLCRRKRRPFEKRRHFSRLAK